MNKPLVSICLITYNQEKIVDKAVRSILEQDYDNLEIIISDDCSTDGTWRVITETVEAYRRMGGRQNNVILNRNEVNLGIAANFCKVFKMSKGEVVINAAGDDVATPDRASKIAEAHVKFPDVTMFSSLYYSVFADGRVERPEERDVEFEYVESDPNKVIGIIYPLGATLAYTRNVYEEFGDMSSACWSEDWAMIARAVLLGKFVRINRPLIYYRKFDGVSTSKSRGLERSIKINKQRLGAVEQVTRDIRHAQRADLADLITRQLRAAEKIKCSILALDGEWVWERVPNALRHARLCRGDRRSLLILFCSVFPRFIRRVLFAFH